MSAENSLRDLLNKESKCFICLILFLFLVKVERYRALSGFCLAQSGHSVGDCAAHSESVLFDRNLSVSLWL